MGVSTGSKFIGLGLLLLLLLMLGPMGLVIGAIGLLVAGVLILSTGDDEGVPDRVNCPDCGAPNPPDADTCTHCETSLLTDSG